MAVAIYLRPGWSLDGLQKSWCHLHLLTLMMSILDGWPPTCLCAYMVYMFVWFSHGSFSNTITGWCFGLLFTFYVFNKPNPIRNDHPQIKSVPRVAEIYCSLPEPRWYLARWFSVHESASRYLSDDDIKVFTECCDPCLYWHYQPLLLVFSQFRYHIYIYIYVCFIRNKFLFEKHGQLQDESMNAYLKLGHAAVQAGELLWPSRPKHHVTSISILHFLNFGYPPLRSSMWDRSVKHEGISYS